MSHRSLPVLAVAVVLIAAGCTGNRPTTTLPAGQRAVTRIELVGVRAFAHADVLAGLATEQARRDGLPFERAQVREDRRRVLARYVRAGYWSAEVDSEVDDDSGQVRVRFTVVEGPRARLAAVDISGLPAELTRDDVRGAIDLADGAPFDYAK
ncbi:MAG TPA: POTRA domain-containing protein, partial [Kofleriaceae bacterium]|nr:POTRA domain-containing protein [Kofleriaceae bacterium]